MDEIEEMDDGDNKDASFEDGSAGGSPSSLRQSMESLSLRGSPRNKSRGDSSGPSEAGVRENTLYENIRKATVPIQDLVKEWILSYNQDSASSLLELIQCFVNCAGCQGTITARMLNTIQYKDLVKTLAEEDDFDDDANYSLNATRVHGRKFAANFKEFLESLFRSCQRCVLLDLKLLKQIINVVKALCGSTKRQFRHTGTFIAMKLTTAVVETAATFQEKVDEIVKENISVETGITNRELRDMAKKFHNLLDDLFESIFKVRFRDNVPEIRCMCIEELGFWILKYPQNFFNPDRLRYIGWLLSDEVLAVKIKCIKALQPLYNSKEFSAELAPFTTKFKDRMIEMVRELNNGTLPAIKLLNRILKNEQDLLTSDDCEQVYELVYAPNRAMAQAAGTFLMTMFLKADNHVPNSALLRQFIEFLIESELPEKVAYVVDSVIDIHPMLKDWSCMTSLLLPDHSSSKEQPLNENESNMLIKLMACSVKQAATGEQPVARKSDKKNEMEIEADRRALTDHFVPLMVQLLDKYSADSEQVSNLLIIPHYFKLSMLMERDVEVLLQAVSNIVASHTDEKVLFACAKIFNFFCKSFPISKESESLKNMLMNGLVDNYLDATKKYLCVIQQANKNTIEGNIVISSLKKLSCFYSFNCFDYGSRVSFEEVFQFVKFDPQWDLLSEEIAKLSITCCFHVVMQEFYQLRKTEHPSEETIASFKLKLIAFLDNFEAMMAKGKTGLKVAGFTTICDLLFIFGKPFENHPHLNFLGFKATNECKTLLTGFIEDFVFDPNKFADFELEVRRSFLSAFCRLIQHNIVGVKFAAKIFKNYVLFSQDYGDIIGDTLDKVIQVNSEGTARTVVISMSELFTQMLTQKANRKSPFFIGLKNLAKKLSNGFGSEIATVTQAMFALHCDGIGFSVKPFKSPEDPRGPPPNIEFLELLCEFSNKLSEKNKKDILKYLEKKFQHAEARDGREWSAYEMYRRSLIGPTRQSSRLSQK